VSATTTAVERRSNPGRLISAAAISIVTYFAARAMLEMDSLAPAWRVMAAVVPVPFFVWVLYEILRSARHLDELQRRMHLEALAFAYPLLLTLLMLLGLLELAVPLNPDNWSYRHVWQMQGIIYLIGLILAYRRYGVGQS
jgi:hypothetical protein